MLPRTFRLPAKTQFVKPTTVRSSFITVRIEKNVFPYNRFGFVVSKRIAKTAVERNRIKRSIRACVEQLLGHMLPGHDILFIVSRHIQTSDHRQLFLEVEQIILRTGLLSEK